MLSVFLLATFLANIRLHNRQYYVNIDQRIAKMLAEIYELLNLDNTVDMFRKARGSILKRRRFYFKKVTTLLRPQHFPF